MTSFINKWRFCHLKQRLIETRFYISFLIIINLVIINYIGQFMKPVGFLCLACILVLDFSAMAGIKKGEKEVFTFVERQ